MVKFGELRNFTARQLIGAVYGRARLALGRVTKQAVQVPIYLNKQRKKIVINASTKELLSRELSVPVPSEDLIFLVNGHRSTEAFARSRSATAANIIELLAEANIDFREFRSVLDFGCGCGRVLAAWEHFIDGRTKVYGFDINSTLIEFCRQNIPFAETKTSSYYPPLPVADQSIDFAYAASVWTHLSLPASMQWAGEFARVIKPGGIAMVSYHGTYFAPMVAKLGKDPTRQLEETGFYMHSHMSTDMTFEGSNAYATFMTSAFFRSLFVGFELVRLFPGISHGPNPFASYQDIAVLRRI